ncbi:MAG: hypothetical protein WBG92_21725 [Thiohalocapsa sp.]
MNTAKKLSRIALAAAAAAAFSTATVMSPAHAEEGKNGKCMGANGCKGHSSCKSAENACAGKNACKGKGFVTMTKEQCEQISGTESFLWQDLG